jgi:uncharacterized protein YutE (UPF0331/DUF86 family)
MDKLYPQAIIQHTEECVEQLDELSTIVRNRSLSALEFRAAERLLQLLIESGIGVAKHWLRSVDKSSPPDAYQCFAKLAQEQVISDVQLANWKKIIGLRNVLVHDYLNTDPAVISSILENRYYAEVQQFIREGCKALD